MLLLDELTYGKNEYVYHRRETDLCSGLRFHSGYEFVYVYSGLVRLSVNGLDFDVNAGEAALIFPNVVHSWQTPQASDCNICVFSESYVPEFSKKHRVALPETPVFALPHGDEVIESLMRAKNDYMLKGIFYCLLSMVIGVEDTREASVIAVSDKVLKYIEQNYSRDITLSDVSAELNYQYNYLSSLINKIFKMSFSKLLNKYRIYTAQQMLRQQDDKITAVATRCGYSSLRSFNRNFKKVTGQTPSEYLSGIGSELIE